MKKSLLPFALFLAGLCSLPAAAETLVLRQVKVFDGERMLSARDVLVQDGRVATTDFHGAAPAAAREIDGKGKTLLPGLIDAHVHAFQHHELPLLFGVTSEVDMFSVPAVVQDYGRRMAAGRNTDRADLFSAGILATVAGGHGTEYGMKIPTLSKPEEAQAFVDARLAEGSRFIKIVMENGFEGHPMPSLDAATVAALIQAAHARGKLAVVHISRLEDARTALEAGADGLVHLFNGGPLSSAELQSFVALVKQRGAFVIPTLSVLESIAGFAPEDILGDPSFTALLTREQLQTLKATFNPRPMPQRMAAPRALVAALSAAGVPVLAGTDAGNPGTLYGASQHHELAALVAAGMTPVQALQAGSSAVAKAFGLGQRGCVAAGCKADLLLVDGDPSVDIHATRRIVAVWKDGEAVAPLRAAQLAKVAAQNREPADAAPRLPADGRISLFSPEKLGAPFGQGWIASSDRFMGGKSQVHLQAQAPLENGQVPVLVEAEVAAGYPFPWAGIAFMPGSQMMGPADLSAAKRLVFRVKGDGKSYQVSVMSQGRTSPIILNFTAGPEWQEVSLPLASFSGVDTRLITMLGFQAGPAAGKYAFQLADVRLLAD
ncbi:CIA30 family protein [Massilia sp. TS11]|uniref:CIA30 family protein n=1 Tax=Massilia sp. TS11 TaxID=2908003 RepID=UPI001EDC7E0F|nr:CIA30 family protein [Massilia sp. TS11]MCG2584453.1 CIA30 family protein [Massilia sp. TS11]